MAHDNRNDRPRKALFVSVDIKADGRIPGRNSMLSFGSAAFTEDKALVAVVAANLETLPGAEGDPETMAWWKRQPEARGLPPVAGIVNRTEVDLGAL